MRKSSLKYLLLAGVAGGLMAFTVAQEGSISGSVTPVEASAVVWTVAGSDTLKAAADATTGAFEITGVPAGDYVVTIDGADPYVDTTLTVTVQDGQATDVGEVQLSEAAIDSDAGGF
ncbi:MAG TPA: hypothetical protein VIR29_13035 [Anseongella sp.]